MLAEAARGLARPAGRPSADAPLGSIAPAPPEVGDAERVGQATCTSSELHLLMGELLGSDGSISLIVPTFLSIAGGGHLVAVRDGRLGDTRSDQRGDHRGDHEPAPPEPCPSHLFSFVDTAAAGRADPVGGGKRGRMLLVLGARRLAASSCWMKRLLIFDQ